MRNKVLIVDDDKDVVEMVVSLLDVYGTREEDILIGSNTDEGLELISEHLKKISHVLCDYNMPGATGGELCKMIKEKQSDIFVILHTGDHSIKLENLCHVDHILRKPYGYDEFERVLKMANP